MPRPSEAKPFDGFIVRKIDGTEVHRVACSKSDPQRERSLMGLMRNMDLDNFYVEDTRDTKEAQDA